MRLLRFTARTQRRALVVGTVLTALLALVTGSAYQDSYTDAAARYAAAELARQDAALTMMYGTLAQPGTATQLYAWEIGTFLTLLAAVLAILVATGLTRAAEDSAAAELLRATGLTPVAPLRAAITVLTTFGVVLAAVTALAVGVGTNGSAGADPAGALVLGADVGLTFLLLAMLTVVVAQVMPSASATREVGFALLGISFAVRGLADSRDLSWLNGLSPLGLRALTEPYAGNHALPLIGALAVAATLAGVAGALQRRRDLGAGLVHPTARAARRLPVRGIVDLERRLRRRPLVLWAAAVTVGGAVFTAMGSSAVASTANGDVDGGFLGAQLAGNDPAAAYLAYNGTVIGIVAGVYAVLGVLALADEERSGRLAHLLATGLGRVRVLATVLLLTAVGSFVILALTALSTTVVAAQVLDGDRITGQAFAQVFGQWPALLALGGLTAVAVALGSRYRHLGWIPLGYSAFVALLGRLLELPEAMIDLGLFGHVPTVGDGARPWGLALIALVAVLCAGLGIRRFAARDLAAG